MSDAPNKIAHFRKMRKMTQQELASKLGVHVITVSNLERGKLFFSAEWMERIAKELQVTPDDLLIKARAKPLYIGGFLSGRHLFFAGDEQEYFTIDVQAEYDDLTSDIPRWLLVRDNSLYPTLRRGDVVRGVVLVPTHQPHLDIAYGRMCLIQTKSDDDMVGFLSRGSKPGLSNFTPLSEPVHMDITMEFLMVIDQAYYQPTLPGGLMETLQELELD